MNMIVAIIMLIYFVLITCTNRCASMEMQLLQGPTGYDDQRFIRYPQNFRRHHTSSPHATSNKTNDRYFYFAGDDGIVRVIDSQEEVDTYFLNRYKEDPNYNNFLLYTRKNPVTANVLIYGEKPYVFISNFDSAKVTVIIVHGWKGSRKSNMNVILTNAFLTNADVNVIIYDWSILAGYHNYNTVKAGTPIAGRSLGQFINWLFINGFVMYHRLHLIGFSFGAHVVGNAGRETGGAVGRITGLDPAGPYWQGNKYRLMPTDAQYVEVIHTNTKQLGHADGWAHGYLEPCGDADFYPNGGGMMPGCYASNVCSHIRAYEYMTSSINHNSFEGNQCSNFDEVEQNTCKGPTSIMGNADIQKHRRGVFRVNTKTYYPYV